MTNFDALKRLFGFIVRDDATGCWVWKGSRDRGGYGKFSIGGATYKAHRASWLLLEGGRLDPAAKLDHGCRNRACVNPAHLEPVSNRTNTIRGFEDRRAFGTLPLFPGARLPLRVVVEGRG